MHLLRPTGGQSADADANIRSEEGVQERERGGAAHRHHLKAVVPVEALNPADSPRLSGENEEHILQLVETDAVLPAIVVHRSTMRVVDGMHRLRAAIAKGLDEVEVEFFDGSDDEAFIRSVEMNVAHGLPLTLADRKAAAARIMATRPELSDRAIAGHCGLSDKTVAAIRRSTADLPQSNGRRGEDGRVRPLDGRAGRHRAREVIAMRPDASLREIARVAGISVSTAKDVRDRLRSGSDRAEHAVVRPAVRPGTPGTSEAVLEGGRERPAEAGPGEASTTLDRLMRDPSLRLSEAGRELLRILHFNMTVFKKWPDLAGTVPVHCAELIAKLAQQYSQGWQGIGYELEQRSSLAEDS